MSIVRYVGPVPCDPRGYGWLIPGALYESEQQVVDSLCGQSYDVEPWAPATGDRIMAEGREMVLTYPNTAHSLEWHVRDSNGTDKYVRFVPGTQGGVHLGVRSEDHCGESRDDVTLVLKKAPVPPWEVRKYGKKDAAAPRMECAMVMGPPETEKWDEI